MFHHLSRFLSALQCRKAESGAGTPGWFIVQLPLRGAAIMYTGYKSAVEATASEQGSLCAGRREEGGREGGVQLVPSFAVPPSSQ